MRIEITKFVNAVAVIGILFCAFAIGARALGFHQLWGFETGNVFLGGIGFMVFACTSRILSRRHVEETETYHH